MPYLQAFQLFMLFWIANFIVALGQMTLAGAFASYYWAFNKPKDIPNLPVLSSFKRTTRYDFLNVHRGLFSCSLSMLSALHCTVCRDDR